MHFRNLNEDIDHVLVTEKQLEETVTRIAGEIDRDQRERDSDLLLLGILKGSVVFMGDLMKKIRTPMEIDFMKVSSYGGSTVSSGDLKIALDFQRENIENLDIVVVEDIIDSGNTLSRLVEYLKEKGARSVRTCALLDKPERRQVEFTPDYVGIEVPDEFVVGYGLDYNEKYRELPYVGVLKEEIYK